MEKSELAVCLIRVILEEDAETSQQSCIDQNENTLNRIKNVLQALDKDAAPLQRVDSPGNFSRTNSLSAG